MKDLVCSLCQKKTALICGLCGCAVCKQCVRQTDKDDFAFLPEIPDDLAHAFYCHQCFETRVAPALEVYGQTLEQAKNVNLFFKDESKQTRLIKRAPKKITVTDCADYDQTILRLAFIAVQKGYNTIVDVSLSSKKIKDGSYQKQVWDGTAFPAQVTSRK